MTVNKLGYFNIKNVILFFLDVDFEKSNGLPIYFWCMVEGKCNHIIK